MIVTGAGEDSVLALRGDDLVCGGGGDDLLRGGRGDDTLIGGSGTDELGAARLESGVAAEAARTTSVAAERRSDIEPQLVPPNAVVTT